MFGYPKAPKSKAKLELGSLFCLPVSGVQTLFALDELLWARLIFALGAVVTAATVVMILRGHLYWNRRGSTDVR